MSTTTLDSEPFDPRARRLCPDGACLGLLDDTNHCKVCGVQDGDAPPAAAPTGPMPAQQVDAEPAPEAEAEPAATPAGDGAAFSPGRALCPDGRCIGIIGSNGRCKVCGRQKES